MKSSDYKRIIIKMLSSIEDNEALKAIYYLVQKHFLNK